MSRLFRISIPLGTAIIVIDSDWLEDPKKMAAVERKHVKEATAMLVAEFRRAIQSNRGNKR